MLQWLATDLSVREIGAQLFLSPNTIRSHVRSIYRKLRVGSLWINDASRFRLDSYPFGGVGASGFGREGVRYAMEELSQWKFTGMRLTQ